MTADTLGTSLTLDNKLRHQTLMVLTQAGDSAAYVQLLVAVAGLARDFLATRTHTKCDIDDLTQEILITVHKARHTYDPRKPFYPWLCAIFNYRFNDYLRGHYRLGKHKTRQLNDTDDTKDHSDLAETLECNNLLSTLLSCLLPKQRSIVEMLYIHENTAQEISQALSISVSNVRTSAHRAMKLLRSETTKFSD